MKLRRSLSALGLMIATLNLAVAAETGTGKDIPISFPPTDPAPTATEQYLGDLHAVWEMLEQWFETQE